MNESIWEFCILDSTPKRPCDKCINRDKVYGCSQESYCDHCVWGDYWKKDMFNDGSNSQKGD